MLIGMYIIIALAFVSFPFDNFLPSTILTGAVCLSRFTNGGWQFVLFPQPIIGLYIKVAFSWTISDMYNM